MADSDSAPTVIDREAIAYARGLLKPPLQKDAVWQVFGAMALLSVAMLGLAFAMLTAPAPGAVEPKARVEIAAP